MDWTKIRKACPDACQAFDDWDNARYIGTRDLYDFFDSVSLYGYLREESVLQLAPKKANRFTYHYDGVIRNYGSTDFDKTKRKVVKGIIYEHHVLLSPNRRIFTTRHDAEVAMFTQLFEVLEFLLHTPINETWKKYGYIK